MMDEAKLSRILKSMEEHDVPQLIMSDPLAIYYLLGKKFAPGERMLVLYLNVNGIISWLLMNCFHRTKTWE